MHASILLSEVAVAGTLHYCEERCYYERTADKHNRRVASRNRTFAARGGMSDTGCGWAQVAMQPDGTVRAKASIRCVSATPCRFAVIGSADQISKIVFANARNQSAAKGWSTAKKLNGFSVRYRPKRYAKQAKWNRPQRLVAAEAKLLVCMVRSG